MNTLMQEVINLVLDNGGTVELFKRDGNIGYNLRTDMKSHLWVFEHENNSIRYEARYGTEGVVNDLDELLWVAKDCLHGRDFMHQAWEKILIEHGMLEKIVTTTVAVSYK